MMYTEKKKYLKQYLILEAKISRYKQMSYMEPRQKKNFDKLIVITKSLKEDIENKIYAIDDALLTEILIHKYILGNTLEEIAKVFHYSKRHIERLHIKALEKIDI